MKFRKGDWVILNDAYYHPARYHNLVCKVVKNNTDFKLVEVMDLQGTVYYGPPYIFLKYDPTDLEKALLV